MSKDILTPVGRLVMGDCFEGQKTDAEGNPLVVKTGPNAGQPRVNYFIGLAIPKNDSGWPDVWAKINAEAREGFPHLFDAAGNCTAPKFAWKITDGDSTAPNTRGTRPCDREGFPGHYVLHFSTGFAPKCYTAGGAELIVNPDMIKRGYYLRVAGNVTGNGSTQQPGVYLNFSMVELVGYGDEIRTGPDGASVFGGAPAGALPPGASATPVTTAPPPVSAPPVTPPVSAPPVTPPVSAPPVTPPVSAPPVTPPVSAPPPAAPAAPATDYLYTGTYMLPDGSEHTKEALLAAGWTDAQIMTLEPTDVPF